MPTPDEAIKAFCKILVPDEEMLRDHSIPKRSATLSPSRREQVGTILEKRGLPIQDFSWAEESVWLPAVAIPGGGTRNTEFRVSKLVHSPSEFYIVFVNMNEHAYTLRFRPSDGEQEAAVRRVGWDEVCSVVDQWAWSIAGPSAGP
jgi:hypothetical protein